MICDCGRDMTRHSYDKKCTLKTGEIKIYTYKTWRCGYCMYQKAREKLFKAAVERNSLNKLNTKQVAGA